MSLKQNVFLLLAGLLLASVTACGGGKTENNPSETGGSVATATTAAETEDNTPKLGFEKQSYNGKEFHMLTCVEADYEYLAEDLTGERVNDAVYARNNFVEDYLGIKLAPIYESGAWAVKNTYNALITNSIEAGDGAYDYVTGMISCIQPLASSAYFTNLFDVPNLNMDNPWWVSSMQSELALNGKLFGIIGDVCLSMYKGFSVYFFNQDLLADYNMTVPYDLVREGKWTLDKMIELTSNIGKDLNGDGTFVLGEDLFGIINSEVPARSMNAALNLHICYLDKDGTPKIGDLDDATVNAIDKLKKYYLESKDVYIKDATFDDNFMEGQCFYYLGKLQAMEKFGDMEADFGIIPMPKLNEEQENYYTQIATATLMIFVPLTVKDTAMTGHVLETLSYYTWKDVVSAYYETSLGQRYSRDAATAEMLEIIRANAVNGFDYSYSTSISGSPWVNKFINDCARLDYDPASQVASQRSVWEANIEKILANYQ